MGGLVGLCLKRKKATHYIFSEYARATFLCVSQCSDQLSDRHCGPTLAEVLRIWRIVSEPSTRFLHWWCTLSITQIPHTQLRSSLAGFQILQGFLFMPHITCFLAYCSTMTSITRQQDRKSLLSISALVTLHNNDSTLEGKTLS